MRNTQLFLFVVLVALESATVLTACNPVRMATNTIGLTDKGLEAGQKLHLKVAPEQAIRILDEVAAQNGWSIASVGDQHDMQGQRGKYFRMETNRFIGGVKQMSGVFFSEAEGCFVVIGKTDAGLPEELVQPFVAAVQTHVGEAQTESKEP
jgi:hypothetical protein